MRDDTIADSSDINFACSQCGQRIVVDKSGVGLAVECPVCQNSMTVPAISSVRRRFSVAGCEPFESGGSAFAGPAFEGSRQELFAAGADFSASDEELGTAKGEVERLRASLKKANEESERIRASATHAQAEIKSFQSDRQQLKADLSQARQRANAAESHVGDLAAGLASATEQNEALREHYDNALALSRERIDATETQLEARERELLAGHAKISGLAESLAAVETELAAVRAEAAGLRGELETAQRALDEARVAEQTLGATRRDLESRLRDATAENELLNEAYEQHGQEVARLHEDLRKTDSGRELLELRGQVATMTAEQVQLARAFSEKTAEAESLATAERELRADLQEIRRARAEAEWRAEANSQETLKQDNEVLRGIIARQNADLGNHHAEVRRLRIGRFGLRMIYGLFSITLLILGFAAFLVFTNRSLDEVLQHFIR